MLAQGEVPPTHGAGRLYWANDPAGAGTDEKGAEAGVEVGEGGALGEGGAADGIDAAGDANDDGGSTATGLACAGRTTLPSGPVPA